MKERQRKLQEEQQLTEYLSRTGWIIFHPQGHPIEKQLNSYQQARDLRYLEGGALHFLFGMDSTHPPNMILIGRKKEQQLHMAARGSDHSASRIDLTGRQPQLQ